MESRRVVLSELYQQAKQRMDWEKIQAYMVLNKWKWQGETPTVEQMEHTCDQLYAALNVEKDYYRVSTGGFVLTFFVWESCIELCLDFVLEHQGQEESLRD